MALYKKGDMVRVTKVLIGDNLWDIKVGDEFTVNSVDRDGDVYIDAKVVATGALIPRIMLKRQVELVDPAKAKRKAPKTTSPSVPDLYTATAAAMFSSALFMPGSLKPSASAPTKPTTTKMKKTKLKVGDRVRCTAPFYGEEELVGKTGTVKAITGDGTASDDVAVSFDDWDNGHDCGSLNLRDTGRWGAARELELLEKKPAKPKELALQHLDAVVVDAPVRAEIESVLKQHTNANTLFEKWGLGEVIEYGRGMTFLFYGTPGTGKTAMAHAIAKAIGVELLCIGPAEIQSSEPGAANRNIQQAFRTATEEGKVLFIDECDSLITSRAGLGMVLAGEVNTLLTELEKFEGVCVLATNRVEHMDEAVERRISLIVEFKAPNEESRKAIWGKLLPEKMPKAPDVSIATLAKHELTGGQIKNAVLGAARLALADSAEEVSSDHFEAAIKRITASKNLMGTASRYRQEMVRDAGPQIGKSNVDVSVERTSSFLDAALEENN